VAKVMISMPDDLLDRVDREARRRQTNRSAFLQEAARRALGRPDPDLFDAALAHARARFEGQPSFESSDLVRREREARDERDRRRL
jgi:Ribbon-helix-helix protein, copG family